MSQCGSEFMGVREMSGCCEKSLEAGKRTGRKRQSIAATLEAWTLISGALSHRETSDVRKPRPEGKHVKLTG